MEIILLAFSFFFFLFGLFLVFYARRGVLSYTSQIMECLEAMIAGKRNIVFQESQETLMGKIQMRMRRLYEIIEMKSEENLRQREQLESMISDISHQVKTPIAGIRMYHNLLERRGISEDQRERFLQASEHQVDKLEFFMQSMIRMSRMETGLIKVQPKEHSVYELLARAICDAALKAEEKELKSKFPVRKAFGRILIKDGHRKPCLMCWTMPLSTPDREENCGFQRKRQIFS